jgi:hypothetical protein
MRLETIQIFREISWESVIDTRRPLKREGTMEGGGRGRRAKFGKPNPRRKGGGELSFN